MAGCWAEAQRFADHTVAGCSAVDSCWGTDAVVVGDSCAGIGSAVVPGVLPQMAVPQFEAALAVGLVPQKAVVKSEAVPVGTVRSIQLLVLLVPPVPVQQ